MDDHLRDLIKKTAGKAFNDDFRYFELS
jgi:hypothetical protein